MNISKKQTKRKTEYFDPSRSHTCKALGDKIIEMIYEMEEIYVDDHHRGGGSHQLHIG